MYMTDINTSLRSNKKNKEDPKSPGVIIKKILSGIAAIVHKVAPSPSPLLFPPPSLDSPNICNHAMSPPI